MSQLVDAIMLEAMDEIDAIDIMHSASDNTLDAIEGSHYTDIAYMDNVDDLESELEDMEGYDPEQDVMDDPETMEDDEILDLVLSGEEDF